MKTKVTLSVARIRSALLFLAAVAATAAAAALVPQPAAGQTGNSEAPYEIGPEDVLQVLVWGRPDLSGPVTVDHLGKIQLPLIGQASAEGRTAGDLGEFLSERYRLLDPSISEVIVQVAQYNSRSISIVGQVAGPGRYGFREIPDIWTVILEAGGALDTADLGAVQVVRKEARPGEPKTLTVDLSGGIEKAPKETLPTLRPKDTIVIPSLAGQTVLGDKFQVLGAVKAPGAYKISAAENVIEAIAISGGSLPYADLGKVRLTRVTEEGLIAYELDLHGHLHNARPIADLGIRAGDTITVPGTERSFIGDVMDGLIRLAPAITAVVSLVLAVS